ncbi:integrase SAM domain protein (plasmid) [Rhodococcus pseudokoreensis]|uniref:Integrase SAM domain protein n=1 Tax=Rhodococcus pseudokoreensis TaxID=2811421 RepID=A0A974VZN0_9NOCA|nr:integrase SAM domain protein [Rhodococcus pseudokoreensis]QSE87723.1 integrase SAM domain protein [Rhodococcus pseudokoreensis]
MTTSLLDTTTSDAVPWPAPDAIILRGRNLHPLADTTNLSRFRDDVWFTSPADIDNAKGTPSLNFTNYPTGQRTAFKAFGLAVLDHDRPAVLQAGAPSDQASPSTLHGWIIELRLFAEWLAARRIGRICDVTICDLNLYHVHVMALSYGGARKADYLHAVRVLWAYRQHLPAECRLPEGRPWGAATARQLAGHTEWNRYNKTPRIQPDTMEALLAWALRVLEDFGPDIREAFLEDRQLMDGSHPTTRFYREYYFGRPLVKRLQHLLPELRKSGRQLPGQRREDGTIEIACGHLARLVACSPRHVYRRAAAVAALADEHGVTVAPDAHLGRITGFLHGTPWKDQPIGLSEIGHLVRMLRTACFVTICYLSGMRGGEVLKLRRGCLSEDEAGQLTLIGYASKGPDSTGTGTGPNDGERAWAVVSVVGTAVTMLESLTESQLLFPPSPKRKSSRPIISGRPLRNAVVNADLADFITWVNNTFARPDGAMPIPPDQTKPVHASRFRRTLAHFVVRRPGGLIAAALQYGHISTKVTLAYAGEADTNWLDDLTIERLEMVIDQIDDDLMHLDDGEHVSGPSAEEYRRRLHQLTPFAGRVVDKVRNAERLLTSTDPSIHHGRGMTCVYRTETALCRARLEPERAADGPDESECRSACTNLAYTDRDVALLRERLIALDAGARDPLTPRPLRDRRAAQALQCRAIVDGHDHAHRGAGTGTEGVA